MSRIRIVVISFAFAAASAFAGASIASAEEGEFTPLSEGCHENVICVYENIYYNNSYYDAFCSDSGVTWKSPGPTLRSATNRCGNKSDWLRTNGTVVACMNPGGNRPSPGNFNEVFIPVEYGAFC